MRTWTNHYQVFGPVDRAIKKALDHAKRESPTAELEVINVKPAGKTFIVTIQKTGHEDESIKHED